MKNQTYVILAIIFTIIISVFAVLNVSVVEVNYLFWRGESPLIFVILFSVLLGGILTTAVGTGKYLKLRRVNKSLERQVTHLEDELKKHASSQTFINEPINADESDELLITNNQTVNQNDNEDNEIK